MLEIFFFPGPINRAFYAILASVKSWTAIKTGREMSLSMSLRENNYTSKIGKRRMSNREFLPFPTLLYHSFRRFPTGPRSRSTIDRCRFSFFFFLRRNHSNNNFNPFAKIVDRERSFIIVDGVC